VIYHLIEDAVFDLYMRRVFGSATRFVVIYSTNTHEQTPTQAPHVRHRRFTDWIADNCRQWALIKHVPNSLPYTGDFTKGSLAEFYIYEKTTTS
ncbi:MAG: hypothetical protein ACTSPX_04045, partial [Candidatus Thorarchaeota archaeon]